MLYPQYGAKFDKTITKRVMENLVKEAKLRLADIKEDYPLHPEVKAHWQRIAAGIPPFGYKVVEDN